MIHDLQRAFEKRLDPGSDHLETVDGFKRFSVGGVVVDGEFGAHLVGPARCDQQDGALGRSDA